MKLSQFFEVSEFPFYLYDNNGKEVYCENSNGYWSKKERDSDGNVVYFESSDGYWVKREFDSQGNVIYHENPDGVIKYNRPKKSCSGKIVEIDGVKYILKEVEE